MLRIRDFLALATVLGYLLFNYGFMQLRIPPSAGGGLPLAEIVLLLSLATFNYSRVFGKLAVILPLAPLSLWWGFGILCAMIGFASHGMWALRDAVHVMESLFLLVGFVLAGRDPERFWRLLPRFLVVAVIYGLMAPFQGTLLDLSPTIVSGAGEEVAIFGGMVNAPYLLIMAACYLILFHRGNMPALVLATLLIGYAIAVFQARTIYLVLAAVFGLLTFYRRSTIPYAGLMVGLLALLLGVVTLTGLELDGRLGSFSGKFLVAHFLAIFGICDGSIEQACSAAEGVGQRLEWWGTIFADMQNNAVAMLFGLGYGIPLTDFHGATGAQVREPHNSYVSILARTGIVGALCWTAVTLSLVRRWHLAFKQCRALGWQTGENRLLILMVFFIAIWVLAIGEDGFEKPYNVVPFYFFWGIALRMAYALQTAREARIGEWTIRRRVVPRIHAIGDQQAMKVLRPWLETKKAA